MAEDRADLNVTVGALLIGVLVTAVGYGITTMQTYLYTSRFPRDPTYLKTIVAVLFVLDTTHVVLSWHVVYHYLILNYGDWDVIADSVWSFNVTIILTSIITLLVHSFFARRVYILGDGQWFLTMLIIMLSIVRLTFGCYVSIRIFILKNFSTLPVTLSPYVGTALGSGTLADFIVTGSLVFYLRRHRTGFRGTDSLVDRIVSRTVNNGLLTSIVSLAVVIAFSVMPNNMIFLALHLFLSKLYANSLLGTLNFRKSHRGRGLNDDPTTLTVGTLRLGRSRIHGGLSMLRFGDTTATITETATQVDTLGATESTIRVQIPAKRDSEGGLPSSTIGSATLMASPLSERRSSSSDKSVRSMSVSDIALGPTSRKSEDN